MQFPSLVLFSLLAAVYLPVLINALRRSESRGSVRYVLGLYVLAGFLLAVGEALWRGGALPAIDDTTFQEYQTYAALLLSIVMLLALAVFLKRTGWAWFVGATVLVVALFLSQAAINLPYFLLENSLWSLSREELPFCPVRLGWLIFTLGALIAVGTAHRRSKQPLFRNRLKYWLPFFTLIVINDVLIFVRNPLPGNPLRLAGAWLMGYVVLTHDPPDVRGVMRSVLIYGITTLLIALLYIAGIFIAQFAFQTAPGFNPLLVGTVIALVLATFFTPLLGAVRRQIDTWLKLDQIDSSGTLQKYGLAISNIIDVQTLASVSIGLIIESLNITRGWLFLVDQEPDQGQVETNLLRAVRSPGEKQISTGTLRESSPIVQYFAGERGPLLQYDLDLLPSFQKVARPERDWFTALQAEVYLPIFARGRWIGLLAFGPKLSGQRYDQQDLSALGALANQTAVALENARLVENLMRLNEELRQAQNSLEKANRDLGRLDRTKTDFIHVVSHELRTPLRVMGGNIELLLEDSSLSPETQDVLQSLQDGLKRSHEIIESMFDIAQIDSRTLQLNFKPTDIADLIHKECLNLKESISHHRHSLILDLPALPYIKADPNTLQKVIFHLITNAIKFTPDEGKITITGQSIPPGQETEPDGGVQITISDTGVGVAPEIQELIFTKFYQPEDPERRVAIDFSQQGGGTGLGLALAKGIVEAHGGSIWVKSPGHDEIHQPGSTFYILFPSYKAGEDEKIEMGAEIMATF